MGPKISTSKKSWGGRNFLRHHDFLDMFNKVFSCSATSYMVHEEGRRGSLGYGSCLHNPFSFIFISLSWKDICQNWYKVASFALEQIVLREKASSWTTRHVETLPRDVKYLSVSILFQSLKFTYICVLFFVCTVLCCKASLAFFAWRVSCGFSPRFSICAWIFPLTKTWWLIFFSTRFIFKHYKDALCVLHISDMQHYASRICLRHVLLCLTSESWNVQNGYLLWEIWTPAKFLLVGNLCQSTMVLFLTGISLLNIILKIKRHI